MRVIGTRMGGALPLALAALATIAAAQEPLPRWREGGTPYDPEQSLAPYALRLADTHLAPTSGLLASPPEYSPTHGVLFRYGTGSWTSVVRDCVVALTSSPAYDEIAYVVVSSAAQQSTASSDFASGGANLAKVRFLIMPHDSIWIRDYGPHFIWQGGALALVDSHYYPSRPQDNFVPTRVGDDELRMPTFDMGLYYSGGNFQPGPLRSGFVTALVNLDNPASAGFDAALIAGLYQRFQGIDTLHVMPQLPGSVDGTGHIDMWLYLVDEDDVIISEFKPGSNATAISITNNAVPYMQALGFTVQRPWAWNVGSTHYTYTNAFRVNSRIFVPIYGPGNSAYLADDTYALAKWQASAGPNVTLVPINCYSIIPAAGAIHCIVMQVPRYTAPVPSVHVLWPDGGQVLQSGSVQTISWVASDTNNSAIPTVDLYWSADGGAQWRHIATTTDTGSWAWTVPQAVSERARVKVRVTAADSDQAEAISGADFRIAPGQLSTRDFSVGGGVDRFGWGYQTGSWSSVGGQRRPATGALSAGNYAALATSNATGGNTDPNRYISPTISSGSEATHTFEFTVTEPPAEIDAIEVLWEGYADRCTQVELYVWDYVANEWGDGDGALGQNRYADSFAGNRDGTLVARLRSGFDRCIGPGGQMTFLTYAERAADESFHDYLVLRVLDVKRPGTTYCSGDGSATACPCGPATLAGHGCPNSAAATGARLDASGTARVAADDVLLSCSSLPPNAAVMFVQGSAQTAGGAGAVFGDGLRCVGGSIMRLGIRNAVSGVASMGPVLGDTPVSARGAVPPAGGTFHYQTWYRDPSAFCTADTYNLSNGLTIVWTP